PPLLPPSVCWHCAPSLHDALPLSISWYRCSACSSCHFMVSFVFIGITSFAGRVPQGSGDSKTKSVQNRDVKRGQESLRNYKGTGDRKSTRLNSSHVSTSTAVFCLR